ncbi:type II secretion system protein [Quadrisphaera oryzae]|uniref:type II secretion system protein n=1 Tax=Quadrisphaera TaxID=317661 RepID=UPI001C96C55D|nr:prepilin-type N-terminal cleavage/methylation domain-containing protein [Quadrisphaera sp. RL12-1S]
MMARIRKAMEEKDQGFTLIELLVVMIIIGILAAIAVPVFLNQRQKAVDSSIKSDLRTVAQSAETSMVDTQIYPASANSTNPSSGANQITIGTATITLSSGNVIAYKQSSDKASYCVVGSNARASATGATGSTAGTFYYYSSLNGGLGGSAVLASALPAGC